MFNSQIHFSQKQKIMVAFGLIVLVVAGRLLPHAWNMTPVIAASLFAGVYLGRVYALAVPAIAMFLSDMFIGFYDPHLFVVVYGSLLLIGLYALVLKRALSGFNIFITSLSTSCFFFLTTNWAVWQFSAWYPKTVDGLLMAYAMGIPFLKNALIGDIFYTGILFGSYAVVAYLLEEKHTMVVRSVT